MIARGRNGRLWALRTDQNECRQQVTHRRKDDCRPGRVGWHCPVCQPLSFRTIDWHAVLLRGVDDGFDNLFPVSRHAQHRAGRVKLAESKRFVDSVICLGVRYGLAVLCSECLERLAIFVTAPGRQARAQVFGADRYARTHEIIQDEGTGKPE